MAITKSLKTYGKRSPSAKARSPSSSTPKPKPKAAPKPKAEAKVTTKAKASKKDISPTKEQTPADIQKEEEDINDDEKVKIQKIILVLMENMKNVDWFDIAKKVDLTPMTSSSNIGKGKGRGKKLGGTAGGEKMGGTELREYYQNTILPLFKKGDISSIPDIEPTKNHTNKEETSPMDVDQSMSTIPAEEGEEEQASLLSSPVPSIPADAVEEEDNVELDNEEESQFPKKRKAPILVLPPSSQKRNVKRGKKDEEKGEAKPKTMTATARKGRKEVVVQIGGKKSGDEYFSESD
ncbi:hypothetical protein L486_08386 [Kwoniella mangroviensis CBS 10435]|uniref:Uncharacterized protein n=1 Tax=Kwoniella mangroviensis CBS 10435 TaxID=1331196 RepID=A0A1B9IEX7_9TREE|nr:hypothetical protein L486_08386 [Kwoniella mangroviensis CBS 10435]